MPVVTDCVKCEPLVACRKQIVGGRGSLDARMVVVAQNPGKEEDETGRALIGQSGHVLAALLTIAGIDPPSVYLINALRCLTPGNRRPKTEEIQNCLPYLIEELEERQPELILALGAVAIEALYGKASMGSVAGQTLSWRGVPLIATYHPAAILRKWSLAPLVLTHFEKVKRLLDGTQAYEELGEYHTITTIEQLKTLRDYLATKELVCLDTETCGVEWKDDELLCISISSEPGEGFVIPILHRVTSGTYNHPLLWPHWLDPFWGAGWPEAREIIREILASPVPKALQNSNFDVRFLERESVPFITAATAFGFKVNNVREDTMLSHKAVAEYLPKESKPNELTNLVSLYTSLPEYETEVRKQSKQKTRMEDVENEVLWKYAAADTDAVARLVPTLRAKMQVEGTDWVVDNISIPMLACCQAMTQRGLLVDRPYFDKLCVYYKEQIATKIKELHTVAGEEFNYNSPQQVQSIIRKLGLKMSGRKTDKSRECEDCHAGTCEIHDQVSRDALMEIHSQTPHDILPLLVEVKALDKLRGTYLDGSDGEGGFKRHIRADGRIHFEFKVGGAETGRLSSSNPNGENLPKEVEIEEWGEHDAFRRAFIAKTGFVIMEADWSQLEVWGLAYETGDQTLLEVLESGRDVHVYVARKMGEIGIAPDIFPHVDPELDDYYWREQHEDLRRSAKTFTFGIGYGLTIDGIVSRLHCTEEDAKILYEAYTTAVLPSLAAYFERIRDLIVAGEPVPNRFGRLRHFPQVAVMQAVRKGAGKFLAARVMSEIESLVREGINFPTQGGGSDLHSLAHVWTENAPELKGRLEIVDAVHDSILGEALAKSDEFLIDTAWIIKENWQRIARETVLPNGDILGWRVPVEVSFGPSWGKFTRKLTAKGDVIDLSEYTESGGTR